MGEVDRDRLIELVQDQPWAIMPNRIAALIGVVRAAIAGKEPAELDVAKLAGGQRAQRDRDMRQSAGVMVIPLTGIITPKASIFDFFGIATGLDRWTARFQAAVRNPDIESIVIDIDSPGGSVYGVEEASEIIFGARKEKTVISVANPLAASAAYFLGSSAKELVITPSGETGSIGVVSVHVEFARALEEAGIGVTVITAGKHKFEGNPWERLSEDAAADIQAIVDAYYDDFVAAVSRNRDVKPSDVRNGLGEGRVLTAERAVEEGLADRIATLDTVLMELGVDQGTLIESRARAEKARTRVPQGVPLGGNRPGPNEVEETHFVHVTTDADISILTPAPDGVEIDSDVTKAATLVGQDEPEVYPAAGSAEVVEDDAEGAASAAASEEAPEDSEALSEGGEDTVKKEDTAAQGGAAAVAEPDVKIGADATEKERKRAKKITELCALHGCPEKAADWIDQGLSVGQAAEQILDAQREGTQELRVPEPKARVDLDNREGRKYSITRLIRYAAGMSKEEPGLELEVSDQLAKQLDRPGTDKFRSFMIPTMGLPRVEGASMQAVAQLAREFGMKVVPEGPVRGPGAVLETGAATAGQELVFTEPGSFIELLRNRMVTTQLGATFLPGLQGNVSFPKQTGAGTFSWRAEAPGTDVTLTDLATDQVTLSPKDGTSATSFSKRLLAQSVVNVEQLVRMDLAKIAAIGLDFAALHGGGAPAPTGIYNVTGVNPVAFGGAPTWAKIVEMETAISADNADIGVMAYATTPEVRGNAKTTPKEAGTAQFIWTGGRDDAEMNGYRAMASNQFLKNLGVGTNEHGTIFGVWDQLLIGEWGALEILVDPYTLARQGLIIVVLFVIADIAVRYPEAFSIATGLIPA